MYLSDRWTRSTCLADLACHVVSPTCVHTGTLANGPTDENNLDFFLSRMPGSTQSASFSGDSTVCQVQKSARHSPRRKELRSLAGSGASNDVNKSQSSMVDNKGVSMDLFLWRKASSGYDDDCVLKDTPAVLRTSMGDVPRNWNLGLCPIGLRQRLPHVWGPCIKSPLFLFLYFREQLTFAKNLHKYV